MTAPWPDPSPSSIHTPTPPTLGDLSSAALPGNSSPSCVRDDEAFKYAAYTAAYLLLFPVALLSNAGALAVFLCLTPRRSASTVLMTNMALSDAGFSLTLPLRLAYYFRGARWDLPDWLCRLCVYCFYVNLYTSVLFLTGLSALRWLAVVRPLLHRSVATPARAALGCLGIWAFVGAASSPFLLQGVTERAGLPRCFEPRGSGWRRILALNYVGVAFGFLLPFFTILGCYGSIVRRLTEGQPGGELGRYRERPGGGGGGGARRRRRVRRSVRLVAAVTATFLLCFLPYHVMRTLHLHAVVGGWGCAATVGLQRALVVTLCLAAGNSAFNPLLYYLASASFRSTVRSASRNSSSFGRRSQSSLSRPSLLFALTRRRGAAASARTDTHAPDTHAAPHAPETDTHASPRAHVLLKHTHTPETHTLLTRTHS